MKFQDLKIQSYPSIVGLLDVKKQLTSALILKRNVVLIGPPGMGKTTLVRDVAALLEPRELNMCGFNCSPENPVCPSCLKKKANGEKIETKKYSGKELFVRVQGSPDLSVEDLIGLQH